MLQNKTTFFIALIRKYFERSFDLVGVPAIG
jgi:hypothetical protein